MGNPNPDNFTRFNAGGAAGFNKAMARWAFSLADALLAVSSEHVRIAEDVMTGPVEVQ